MGPLCHRIPVRQDEPMSIYAVTYTYRDLPDLRAGALAEHRAFLADLGAAGRLLGAGAYTAGDPGALLVFRTGTRDELDTLLASDPFARVGLISATDVREWGLMLGPWADGL